jgi:hypothetical protein
MKTDEEKIAVMQAKLAGKPIERSVIYTADDWVPSGKPAWNWAVYDYRVAVTKPSIDWSVLSEEVVAIATDENGRSWGYRKVPVIEGSHWSGVGLFRADFIASFTPGTCDWRDSLIVRPEGV